MATVTKLMERVGNLFIFTGQFMVQIFRRPFEGRELIRQMDEIGTKSLVLVLVTGCAIGVVLSMQSRGDIGPFWSRSRTAEHVGLGGRQRNRPSDYITCSGRSARRRHCRGVGLNAGDRADRRT